jgi:hypothetical protein
MSAVRQQNSRLGNIIRLTRADKLNQGVPEANRKIPMTLIRKSLIVGIAVESVLAAMFAFSGFGPCGPSNPVGFIGMLGHVFPGLLVVGGLNFVVPIERWPDWIGWTTIAFAQAIFYCVVSYRYLSRKHRRDS